MDTARGLLGMTALLFIAWLLSNNKRKINLRLVIWGLSLQLILAIFLLGTDAGDFVFQLADKTINKLLSFALSGAGFVFGALINQGGLDVVSDTGQKIGNAVMKDTESHGSAFFAFGGTGTLGYITKTVEALLVVALYLHLQKE